MRAIALIRNERPFGVVVALEAAAIEVALDLAAFESAELDAIGEDPAVADRDTRAFFDPRDVALVVGQPERARSTSPPAVRRCCSS